MGLEARQARSAREKVGYPTEQAEQVVGETEIEKRGTGRAQTAGRRRRL